MNAITIIKSASGAVALPSVVGGEFASLPGSVQKAIVKLDLAYPAGVGNLSERENELRREIYAAAIEDFPVVIALAALKHILLHNPRNTPKFTQPPTPQDVHDLCRKMQRDARDAVEVYAGGGGWSPPQGLTGSQPPWTPGCLVSSDMIKGFLRASTWWCMRLAPPEGVGMPPDEVFERIPYDVFEDGDRERIVARRNEFKERAAKRARADEADRLRRLEKYGEPVDPMTNEPLRKKVTA